MLNESERYRATTHGRTTCKCFGDQVTNTLKYYPHFNAVTALV